MTKEMEEFYSLLISKIIMCTAEGKYKWEYIAKKHSIQYRIRDKAFLFEVQPGKTYLINTVKISDIDKCGKLREAILKSKPRLIQKKNFFINENPFDKLYKQVPYSGLIGKCPFCGEQTILKPTELIVCKEPNYTKRVMIHLAYCVECEMAYADEVTCALVQSTYDGFFIPVFNEYGLKDAKKTIRSYSSVEYSPGHTVRVSKGVENSEKPERTKAKTDQKYNDDNSPYGSRRINGKYFSSFKYVEIPENINRSHKYNFVTYRNSKLVYDYYNNGDIETIEIKMPCLDGKMALVFNANYNSKWQKAYIDECVGEEILKAFSGYKGDLYRINGRFIWPIIEDRDKANYISRMTMPSQVFLVILRYENGESREYSIVSKKSDINHSEYAYHYSEDIAREILTAAFHETRHKKARILQTDVIVDKIIAKTPMVGSGNDIFMPSDIILRSDGGFGSSVKNSTKEVIATLLYSPYTQRYECLNMTYDKENEYCYVDPGLFRKHLHEYGNPGLPFGFESKGARGNGNFYSELNTESVLYGFGYNVSETQGLSDKYRRDILADIMDLQILSAAKIISLIDFFISSHSSDRYERARNKWRSDIEFVKQYRVNPERFLIIRNNVGIRR